MTEVQKELFSFQDEKYKVFSSKLIPTVDLDRIIGVRAPVLKMLAKELYKNDCTSFMEEVPHFYLEENNLHSYIINQIKDFDKAISAVDSFLPYVDNWSTCDAISPKVFVKDIKTLYKKINEWCDSEKTYTIRFGIKMLMTFFLDKHFDIKQASKVAKIRSKEYYVNMMIAWYFATALSKQYEKVIEFIDNKKLDTWTHNKSIQKAIESYKVLDEHKKYLRTKIIK